ncbi:MAG: DMSO/TMAO reductase YedYZ molybdopterin-dependent catalytic subunit [Acidimicrobiales bacterium]|jgi:DMSO/TMAO reductase YedYZ molybdopterin-dependent catalytic subunit
MTEERRTQKETDEQRALRYAALEAEAPTVDLDEYRRISRRSMLTGGLAVVVAGGGWRWLQGRPEDLRANDLLRKGHEFNETIWRKLTREGATAPTFDRSRSSMMRVNGRHGLDGDVNPDQWALTVIGPDDAVLGTHSIDEITGLPKVEMTIEHKCVEGWSHIVTWGGVRFSDFAAPYVQALGRLPEFVSLETPDGEYYVGLDLASMLHSQTLLTYELEGEPLSPEHGAPLRLTTPNNYGTKQLKRIGTIRFTDLQPADYWGERGYDWYAQL